MLLYCRALLLHLILNLLEMEFNRKYYSYSMKNISLPFEKLYKTILIEKVELLIKRIRWKTHLYENSGLNTSNPLNYIFKSRKCPPQHKDLIQFENDLLELIKSLKFKKVKNKFLDQLHKDIASSKKSKNVFIFAGKTRNIYETDKNTYSKLLTGNISKTYNKTEHNIYNKINKEAKIIANNYGVSERVDCQTQNQTHSFL